MQEDCSRLPYPCCGPVKYIERNEAGDTRMVCVGHRGVSRGWKPDPIKGRATRHYDLLVELHMAGYVR